MGNIFSGAPTTFSNGIGTGDESSFDGKIRIPSPIISHNFYDDFNTDNSFFYEVITSGTPIRQLDSTLPFGVLNLGISNGGGDFNTLVTKGQSFWAGDESLLWFKARVQFLDFENTLIYLGFHNENSDASNSSTHLYFFSEEGSNQLKFRISKFPGGIANQEEFDFITIENSEFINIGFHYDGGNKLDLFFNDELLKTYETSFVPSGSGGGGPGYMYLGQTIKPVPFAPSDVSYNIDYWMGGTDAFSDLP